MLIETSNALVLVIVTSCLFILFQKKVRRSPVWHATVTPLASIIGSGFLVSAPLLILTSGKWAAVVMAAIVIFAYGLGSSIRFNIRHLEPLLGHKDIKHTWVFRFEMVSRPVLGLAYIISVAFYLKLLSAFLLRGMGFSHIIYENILTTLLLLLIGLTGKYRGLSKLEFYEIYSVNAKLSVIAAIIAGHIIFNITHIYNGDWYLSLYSHDTFWLSTRKLLGILIIIQGFETSRFLGHAYSSSMRINTMRYAQILSGAMYVIFIATTLLAFNDIHSVGETTVIDVCRMIAPVLVPLLIIGAGMSQFSAAIADTIGSGGLLSESLKGKINTKDSYLIISIVSIALTWATNIFEIIVVASKAFAIYYALQLLISVILLINNKIDNRKYYIYLFTFLFIVMILVVIFGISVE